MIWYVLCSGPSLTQADLQRVRIEQQSGAKVIAVNSTIFDAPWADICYAADRKWWEVHHKRVKSFGCRMVSRKKSAAQYGAEVVARGDGGLSNKGVAGNNSGCHAANLAYLEGAKEIVMLGFDCQPVDGKLHHHPDHVGMGNAGTIEHWPASARELASAAKKRGITIINCSPKTALTCFPVMTLDQYLSGAKAKRPEGGNMKVTLNQKQAIAFQAFTLYPGENDIHQDFIDNAEPIFWVWVEQGRITVPEQPQFEVEEPEDAEVSDDEANEEPRGFFG